MARREILYFKLRNFFAEVERQRRPELVGRPVVVGKASGNTCVVVSASAEARRVGVHEGITVRHAQRFCQDAAIIESNPALYREVFEQVLQILSRYSPLLEPYGPDGAFLDVTAVQHLFSGHQRIIAEAASRIHKKTGLNVTAAVASNKLVAEIAARIAELEVMEGRSAKSRLLKVVPGTERDFLAPLPVDWLNGLGKKTVRRLDELGIRTIGELAVMPERLLIKQFGVLGSSMYRQARGVDYSSVKASFPEEVVVGEHTFSTEVEETAELDACLAEMAVKVFCRLKGISRGARTVTLALVLVSGSETLGRQLISHTVKHPIASESEIYGAAARLLRQSMREGMRVISIHLKLSDLKARDGVQLGFLDVSERDRRLSLAMDGIRARFGENSIHPAAALLSHGRQAVLARLSV